MQVGSLPSEQLGRHTRDKIVEANMAECLQLMNSSDRNNGFHCTYPFSFSVCDIFNDERKKACKLNGDTQYEISGLYHHQHSDFDTLP